MSQLRPWNPRPRAPIFWSPATQQLISDQVYAELQRTWEAYVFRVKAHGWFNGYRVEVWP